MPVKVLSPTDFRVVVTPDSPNWFFNSRDEKRTEQYYRETCKEILNIKRHVDNVQDIRIENSKPKVCSYCGYPWETTSDVYNGGCCDEDIDNAVANKIIDNEGNKL